jgi:hypothetical protein
LPHVENPPRRHLPGAGIRAAACGNARFQWAPTLGGECFLSRLGVTRVPIRRVLATFATAVELPNRESEYVLLGGARWSRVFVRGVEDVAVVERLRGLEWEGVEHVRRELMRLWDSLDDEDFVGALRELLESVGGDLK